VPVPNGPVPRARAVSCEHRLSARSADAHAPAPTTQRPYHGRMTWTTRSVFASWKVHIYQPIYSPNPCAMHMPLQKYA